MSNPSQINDSRRYQERTNLQVSNANLFIANNNNPFLVSPYSPPANLVRQAQIEDINILISSITGNLSTVIDLTTWTLRISTITNSPYSNQVSIRAPDILLDGTDITLDAVNLNLNSGFQTNITGVVNFPGTTNFNSISTNILNASNAAISSLNVTTLNALGNITFTTMTGSNISVSTMTVHSTLSVSSVTATGNISFQTMTGPTINVTSYGNIQTMGVADGTISTLRFSSIYMEPGTLSTGTTTLTSSIIIYIGGTPYKIPLEKI